MRRVSDKHPFMLVHEQAAASDGGGRQADMNSAAPIEGPTWGVWIFYAVFVVLLACEGIVVGAVIAAARSMHHPSAGPLAAWALFVVGGTLLGLLELRAIRPQQRMRDPVLRACCWLQRHLGITGYLVNALIIGGAPGSAVALVQTEHPRRRELTFLAAVLFASLWVPLFVLVWR
jgi:hypothetical protein